MASQFPENLSATLPHPTSCFNHCHYTVITSKAVITQHYPPIQFLNLGPPRTVQQFDWDCLGLGNACYDMCIRVYNV